MMIGWRLFSNAVPATSSECFRLKIIARKQACAGHARCAALAPEVFELDADGFIAFKEKTVPPGLEQKAQRGVRSCPERVLSIADE